MSRQPQARQFAAIKAALFVACLVPIARLVWGAAASALGANPIEVITRQTGWWTLFLLCATLTVTPLRRVTGANWLVKLRRMLGLFAFFYAVMHFTTFVWFDHWFDAAEIAKDVVKRPFVTVGFAALALLIPLAATSTGAMKRRLGRNWQRLHRAVYAIALLGVLHYWWLVKRDITEPAGYALLLVLLLGARLAQERKQALAGDTSSHRASPSPSRPIASQSGEVDAYGVGYRFQPGVTAATGSRRIRP